MLIRGNPRPISITPPSSLDDIRRGAPSSTPFFINIMANIQVESKVSKGLKNIAIYPLELSLIWLVKPRFIR